MGGLFSTRWDGHVRRRTIGEGTLALDVRTVRAVLAAHGVLPAAPGEDALTWTAPDGQGTGRVALVAVPAPFGGVRHWLRCPECGHRRQTLYTRPAAPGPIRWRCRPCAGLAYPSQRLDPLARLQRRRTRLAERIAGRRLEWDAWPARPRGMHRARYARELWRLRALDIALDEHFIAGATRLLGRMGR